MKKIVILLAVAVLSLGAANAQVKKTNSASCASNAKTEVPAKANNKQTSDNDKKSNAAGCAAAKSTCHHTAHCNGCKGHKANTPQKEEAPSKVSKSCCSNNETKK